MQWRGARRSTNVQDWRGRTAGRGLVGGGIGTILLVVVALFLGVDPSSLVNPSEVAVGTSADSTWLPNSPEDEDTKAFVSAVVAYTEDTWTDVFQSRGQTYRAPQLILFSGAVDSGCGFAQAAMGPFYCPEDASVYLDMGFFKELRDRFQAPGDFAQAYVIAHEVGHHVQSLFGISQQVAAVQQSSREEEGNRASVRLELQADCFAGLWANHTERAEQSEFRQFLESGDVEEALNAASVIGDDRLQQQTQGYVVPETFTHGTSEQRMLWFHRGFEMGTLAACDTFNGANP